MAQVLIAFPFSARPGLPAPGGLSNTATMPLPSAPKDSERRISARHYYRGQIAVRLPSGRAFLGQGIDVSTSGIAFHCDENLAPETKCQVHFALIFASGATHTFTLNGAVVYTSLGGGTAGFKVAVRFEGQSGMARELLAEYALQLA
jgi:PilZ domain